MWAGTAASLLQLPVFSVVYRMFLSPAIGGHANLLLSQTLLGTRWGRGCSSPAHTCGCSRCCSRCMYRHQPHPRVL